MFNNILTKLGLKKKTEEAPKAAVKKQISGKPTGSMPTPNKPIIAKPAAVEVVDVVSQLEKKAGGSGLDWKVSIVDLLKLLDLDNSLDARKELATELGCPADLMGGDYAKMNVWLHKTVLQKIAENGGNIPKELLD
ncbi:MAG: DUF3597 family protein [Anaerolineales bacterium]|nr:DUF3597 family protein [Anaerolineales bacterium]